MRRNLRSPTLGFGQFFGESEVRREMAGFSLARIVASRPPAAVPDHTHETAHLVLVLDGPYLTSAERAEPGRMPVLVYNPPRTTHRDRFEENAGTFFTLSISDARLESVGSSRLPSRPLGLASGPALRAARRLVRTFASGPPRSTARAEEQCVELLATFLDGARPSRPEPPPWLIGARRTLAEPGHEPMGVNEIAALARVHPVHLIRAFHRFFGVTPGEFVRRRRLEAAEDLLENTDLPIVEIALRTGFADQSHFTRAFRRAHARTPAAWRRSIAREKAG